MSVIQFAISALDHNHSNGNNSNNNNNGNSNGINLHDGGYIG